MLFSLDEAAHRAKGGLSATGFKSGVTLGIKAILIGLVYGKPVLSGLPVTTTVWHRVAKDILKYNDAPTMTKGGDRTNLKMCAKRATFGYVLQNCPRVKRKTTVTVQPTSVQLYLCETYSLSCEGGKEPHI